MSVSSGRKSAVVLTAAALLSGAATARAVDVTVTVENLAPTNGVYVAPTWVGFHDGSFDIFNPGVATTPGGALERLAEDGTAAGFEADFASVSGGVSGVITGPAGINTPPAFDPGESNSAVFSIDATANRYFGFAAMIVPSNDAFIGSSDPLGIPLFDGSGNFVGPVTLTLFGSDIWDAGTEANNEMDAAFINQTAPNTGVTTSDPVSPHPGFIGSVGNPGGTPIILGGSNGLGAMFDTVAADFTRSPYPLARITIVPEPATLSLLAGALLALRRRR